MSTIGTHINLGASYMVNDFYRRFVKRDANERHYVRASRLATIVVTLLAAIATYFMSSIEVAWKFLISIGAGAGLVFMLRWFWWRINAWSEISAMSAAGISSLLLQSRAATGLVERLRALDARLPAGPLNASDPHGFAWLMILTTAITTVTWLIVTFLTPPEPSAKLREFYERVRPATAGWRAVVGSSNSQQDKACCGPPPTGSQDAGSSTARCSASATSSSDMWAEESACLTAAALCATFIFWDLGRRGWDALSGER